MSGDSKSRFSWLLKVFLLVVLIMGLAYGILLVGEVVVAHTQKVACQSNLRRIGEALFMYKNQNNNRLPPYLTLLYPDYLDKPDFLACPADRGKGTKGAFPHGLRFTKDGKPNPTWQEELAYTDLDGKTLIPWNDKDSVACSYFYRFNDYPSDNTEEGLKKGITWRQMAEDDVKAFGNKTPVVRCFWHLPPYPKETDGDTTNLLYDLIQITDYPTNWQLGVQKLKD